MRRWPLACLTAVGLILQACGGASGDGGTGPSTTDLGGAWAWREAVTFAAMGLGCSDTGTVTLSQSGNSFTGSGSQIGQCTRMGGQPQEFTLPFTLAEGALTGSSVEFTVDGCPYTGRVSGDSVFGTLSCTRDIDDVPAHATGTWRLVPPPPVVSASVTYPAGDTLAVPGDVVGIRASARARRALTWLGYEVGAPISQRDSVQVADPQAQHEFDLTVPSQVGAASVTVFSRDARGGLSQSRIADLVVLGNTIRRPTRSLVLAALVKDLAVDARRGRVYLSQPGPHRIVSVDLASGAYGPTIEAPFPPAGIDLTPGGDSLVLASAAGAQIGVVSLTAGAPTVATLSVAPGPVRFDVTWVGERLRVLGNNKVMLTLTTADQFSCCEGWLSQYDLATGATQLRTEAGQPPGAISNHEPLARSGDGTRLLLVEACCSPLFTRTYLSATDEFTGRVQAEVPFAPYSVSSDMTGTRFLIANAVLDASLQPVITFTHPDYQQGGATVLSPDGTVAYLAIYDGYLKLRVSDGAVLERVRLPRWSMAFAITPDGNTLVATSGTDQAFGSDERVLLVDLR
jgi:hypothetical protein